MSSKRKNRSKVKTSENLNPRKNDAISSGKCESEQTKIQNIVDLVKNLQNGLKVTQNETQQPEVPICSKNRRKIAQKISRAKQQEAQNVLINSLTNLSKGLQLKNDHNKDEAVSSTPFPFDPQLMFQNFQKLVNQSLTEDVQSSDDEEEYIEYIFKPRQYFLYSICHFCKTHTNAELVPCKSCQMTRYCSAEHMHKDMPQHTEFCRALTVLGTRFGGHIFYECSKMDFEQFRAFRVSVIARCEEFLQRQLEPFEKEIILFPRICWDKKCREWRPENLTDCPKCGQISFCAINPEHSDSNHQRWCKHFTILRKLILHQHKNGKMDPPLPSKVHRDLVNAPRMEKLIEKIYGNSTETLSDCDYICVTQVATAPLTAWFAAKSFQLLSKEELTIHLIGAELQFEADVLNKWELFFLHIAPSLKKLTIVFVGPELNTSGISLDALTKTKVCSTCRKDKRCIKYVFQNDLYHDYAHLPSYQHPDLICYFNPGLHRSTGFNSADTWPETIRATSKQKCPVLVTSYTEYESPLDLRRYLNETDRKVDIFLPPTLNPFCSQKPERNFISEEMAPMIFKNYYCFIIS